ncbi:MULTISPECIES: rhodanese-like domain-containing protein [Vibrio]|jgi:phage shock protein E|uniref:Rhodanese-like domain-containing protein n=1 Tax=Vibrio mediterranei TaxID=689 RepID=A0A2S9ZTX0_9VIBR|nr:MULTISPECIES: rhodanese-like domain-containing protein [Vibrio]AYV22671.1 rhodanese-like domain-containing protein [Vibrio mediterranei]EDL53212.1 phage shock protein E [Vibrio mediterranei AK1]MCF4173064.1 rhodanese-like domain-containing protein [Vibrio sp. McD22-P3]MCG9660007.1 rhodanese-like domain-containing protein [Vibrio mediterranei]MCY9853312.1 rhodanese-like domain-containing protein [Vibrio mediterranei]
MKKILSLSVLCVALTSASVMASERAEQGWQMIEQGAMVVDVRTPDEFADGHLANAVNYPLSDIDKYFANVDKSTPIVVYCRSGNRSGKAMDYLTSVGFSNVHNAGGLEEMREQKGAK